MEIGVLSPGEPHVFRSLLLPEIADALAAGEPVTALALTENDTALGAVAGCLTGDRFEIRSLYVAPDHRREGGGSLLLEALTQLLRGYASGIEISFTITQPEHETLPLFLEATGFQQEVDWGETLYMTSLREILENPFFSAAEKNSGTPFSKLSEGTLSLAEKAARLSDAPLPEGGLRTRAVDRDLSIAALGDKGVQAYVVFDTAWADGLRLSAVWSKSKNPQLIAGLLRSAVGRMREKYPPETKVAVQAVNGTSAALIQTLLPEARPVSHSYYRPLDAE